MTIGLLTSALISAVILVFIIRMFTGQDVSFGNASSPRSSPDLSEGFLRPSRARP